MKIAVLLTTFNRKEHTIACLKSLRSQKFLRDISLDIYLTDDKSSDGTVQAVREYDADVNIITGTGSLFWAGGMRKAWTEATKTKHDYYLLLNDDTVLVETVIDTLLKCHDSVHTITGKEAISVGTTVDNYTGKISYGGRTLTSRWRLKSRLVYSNTQIVDCDLGNANIMLVPDKIVQSIGVLSDHYTHGIADYDYTLKAKRAGFIVAVAPGISGYCTDGHGNNWKSSSTSLKDRIAYLKSPKGLAYKEYMQFIKTFFPWYSPLAYTKLWLKTLLPIFWTVLKK